VAIVALRHWRNRILGALRAAIPAASLLLLCAAALPARAAFNNTTPRASFAGTHNYVMTGGSLRTASNTTDACSLTNTRTAALSGIPAGSTIAAAYLYWGGSGTTTDYTVGFNAGSSLTSTTNITALAGDRFTETYTTKSFFGGFYDVTSLVTGNGNYTFGGLAVDSGGEYCSGQNVMSAWALVVVYRNASEPYRYTRIYDGLQLFRGSAVTTTQTGFRVPDLLDGKVSVITWEGDPDTNSSFPLDGYTEALTFDGHDLRNPACDGVDNMYNSTMGTPSSCSTTTYGADIDTFNVTPYLFEGQSSATIQYSSGNDAVFLSTQIISTTNTPVADLAITKVHNGTNFTAGQNGSYTIKVQNLGPEIATGTATVNDVLPTGLTFVSGTGTGWTCGVVGQTVTCNNSAPSIALNAFLPDLTLTVAVDGTAAASTQNTATVTHPMFDGTGGNSTATDTVAVKRSNLSTSSKSVVDVNGGTVQAGDVLQYTITLANTGDAGVSATGVSVTDDLSANLENLVVTAIPAGSTNTSIGTGGINGTGQVVVTGITVPSGQTRQIVFTATVSDGVVAGDTIDNTATVTNPAGPGANPAAPQQVIPDAAPPVSGNKLLYLLTGAVGSNLALTRTRPSAAGTMTWSSGDGQYQYFYLPPLRKALTLNSANIAVQLRARRSGNSGNRRFYVHMYLNNTSTSISGDSGAMDFNVVPYTDRSQNLTLTQTSFNVGDQLILRVRNRDNRDVQLTQLDGTSYSFVTLNAQTVINVDDLSFYSAAYPSTVGKTTGENGETVYIRATVSDPFGDADISSSTIALTDGAGNPVTVSGWAAKAETPTDDPAVKIFEGSYTIPTSPTPNYGTFTATVNAKEGLENTISHTRVNTFTVVPKALTVAKSHAGDFTAGVNNAYTLLVSNSGGAIAAGTTTTVKDTLAAGLTFVSGTGTGWSCSASIQVVTCTSTAAIAASSSMAPITLTVAVSGALGSSIDNQASVGNSSIASGYQKPGNTDTAIIRHTDVSTSTKTVTDLNGGDANPGDTLRYTITVKESAGYAASGITVTDTLPSGLTGLVGLNAGLSTCTGTPSVVGSTLTVTGVAVAGGGSCKLVFDVQVSGSAGAGLEINNVATVSNPGGAGASPNALVTVAQSQVLTPGNKILYVYANDTMTRVAQGAPAANTTSSGVAVYHDFVLSGVSNPLNIAAGSAINISLWLARNGSTTTTTRNVYVKLFKRVGVTDTQIGGQSGTVTFSSTALAKQNFTITAPSFGTAGNLAAGDMLVLRLYNDSDTGGNDRSVQFQQYNAGSGSTVTISTPTVVHVDSVNIYSAAYPSTSQAASYGQGDTIYIRASVSDPFGFADISGGTIAIKNPVGTTVATPTLVNGTHTKATSGAIRVYEYAYAIPASPTVGGWTASVTANEGSEGTITHTGNGGFNVGGKVTLRKTWGAGSIAGNAVLLTISGGTSPVAGSSTAPSTLTPATSNAATGATITLTEAYTAGVAGNYTTTLACTKDSDGTTVTPTGTGLSRTITMPSGSVTCTFTNSKSVPLTVVKVATTLSDPVNGATNPKAIPGAIIEYQIIVTNPATTPVDVDAMYINDQVPASMDLRVVDIGGSGSGPVQFVNGSPSSGLTYTFSSLSSTTDDLSFSNDGGATWTYSPTAGAAGTDPAVTNVRVNPKGAYNANSAQFTIKLRMRVE
jgi:uncharacterized repeat protein (TIGR01451 family)/fimbrial isopeptide formation D2 family protein